MNEEEEMPSSDILRSNSPPRTSPPSPPPENSNIHLKFLVSKAVAAKINQIETPYRVQLSVDSHYFPGTSEKIITVSGMLIDVLKTVDTIHTRSLDEDGGELDTQQTMKLVVPKTSIEDIVGRYGATIRGIIKESRVGIRISSTDYNLRYDGFEARLVTLVGSLAQQMHAIELILPRLIEDTCYQEWANVPFPIVNTWAKKKKSTIVYDSLPPDLRFYISNRVLPSLYVYLMLVDEAEANFPEVTNGRPSTMLVTEMTKEKKVREEIEMRRVDNIRNFFNICTSEIHEVHSEYNFSRRKLFYVGFGWLLSLGADLKITIVKISSHLYHHMPSMNSLQWRDRNLFKFKMHNAVHFFIRKAVLSSEPGFDDCILMVLYSPEGKLAFARPGDKFWCTLETEYRFIDIIFFRGKFMGIDYKGHVYSCSSENLTVTRLTSTPLGFNVDDKYLVELDECLHIVLRQRICVLDNPPTYETNHFYVFRVENGDDSEDEDCIYSGYSRVLSLRDKSIFVGNNPSMSITSFKGMKKNSIYYTEDDPLYYGRQPNGGGHDTGVYDMGTHTFTKIHIGRKFKSHLTPPIWVIYDSY